MLNREFITGSEGGASGNARRAIKSPNALSVRALHGWAARRGSRVWSSVPWAGHEAQASARTSSRALDIAFPR